MVLAFLITSLHRALGLHNFAPPHFTSPTLLFPHTSIHSHSTSTTHHVVIMTKAIPTKGPAPGRRRNRWTFEQRLCLCMLFGREFDISHSVRARVFNAIFKDELESNGVHNGLELSNLQCQYHERTYQHKASWQATWERACSEPTNAEDQALFDSMRLKIRAAILPLNGGANVPVAAPSTPTTPPRPQPTRQAPATPASCHQPSQRDRNRSSPASYATPGPSVQKRTAATPVAFVDDQNTADSDEEFLPTTKRRRPSPIVAIPPTPQSMTRQLTLTPSSHAARSKQVTKYRSGGRPGATRLLVRMNGAPIWLTPQEFEEAQQPLRNVSEAAAHPPASPLLFRYWHDRSHGL